MYAHMYTCIQYTWTHIHAVGEEDTGWVEGRRGK